ncbi:uncharacterized protein LOC126678647 isoform X2 [Mercurialis annua]|uniref:uncharacterized protein LOC126678647 isoform X2 n=1 Tax=Mercurialis annua TaxID=3986 RepID=UPI0024AD236B|nr:uncharacterized protein LOC126678647 isoform X2 [Mercurialis annua]
MQDFPPGFVFGAATSAYQVEGAANEDGRSPGGAMGVDGYRKYKEDVKLMSGLWTHLGLFFVEEQTWDLFFHEEQIPDLFFHEEQIPDLRICSSTKNRPAGKNSVHGGGQTWWPESGGGGGGGSGESGLVGCHWVDLIGLGVLGYFRCFNFLG